MDAKDAELEVEVPIGDAPGTVVAGSTGGRTGCLAVVFALAPYAMLVVGPLLAPYKDVFFINTGARYALLGFMMMCGLLGLTSLLLAFRVLIHHGKQHGSASRKEFAYASVALVIFALGFVSHFPVVFLGMMLYGFLVPVDYDRQHVLPEERNLGSVYGEIQEAARKDPEQRLARLSASPGRLMHEYQDVFGTDYGILPSPYIARRDPRHREFEYNPDFKVTVDDWSFFYLGYEISNDQELAAFAEAYRRVAASGEGFDKDLQVAPGKGKNGGDILPRLSLKPPPPPEGVTRPPLPSSRGKNIPVLIERIRNNQGKGGHVLFLDGHVEYIDYPGRWPMTKRSVELLDELDRLGTAAPRGEQGSKQAS